MNIDTGNGMDRRKYGRYLCCNAEGPISEAIKEVGPREVSVLAVGRLFMLDVSNLSSGFVGTDEFSDRDYVDIPHANNDNERPRTLSDDLSVGVSWEMGWNGNRSNATAACIY